MTTPAKVLAALFPPGPAIALADLSVLLGTTALQDLPPMSGLHYACLEAIDHVLVNDEPRRPSMLEYATAYLLMRMPGRDAHRLICSEGGVPALADAGMSLLEQVGYAELPRMARAVNAALSQGLALAPQGGDTPDDQNPLPES